MPDPPEDKDPLVPDPVAARKPMTDYGGIGGRGASAVVPDDPASVRQTLTGLIDEVETYRSTYREASEAGGWWNPTPLTEPPLSLGVAPEAARQAAVLVLFSHSSGEGLGGPRLLLTERSTGLRKHPGQISFPGGSAEDYDADDVATALRESHEELGLDSSDVTVLGTLPPAPVSVSGFMVTPVVAVAEDFGRLTPYDGEVARVLQLPVKDLVDPASRYSAVLMRGGVRLTSPAFWTNQAFVWGFTGVLLDRLLDRLDWAQPWDTNRHLDPRQFRR